MSKRATMSKQTRNNWLIDAALFVGAVLAATSGIYYLFVPSGGYQAGRNPMYGVTILFERSTWSDLHMWGGVLMIAAAVVHIAIHWSWITMMSKRVIRLMRGRGSGMSQGAKRNLFINVVVALSFLVTAVSGVYFLFAPDGGYQGGTNTSWDTGFLWSRTTWDLIHTWSGTVLCISAVIHFVIHWRWVKNMTKRFVLSLGATRPEQRAVAR